ncbi:ribonuclease H-like domain-containing protein, partial [Tanacetum coccineum]
MLKSELEKLKKDKESNQLKIENFDNASKSLDKLIGSQITNKSRKGVGFISYNVVPPPRVFLEEFQQPKFEGYGPKTSKSVSEDISNEVRESPDAPLVKELVSDDKLEKKTIFPTIAKIEFVRPKQQEKPVRKLVKYAEIYSFDHVQADCNYHQRERMISRNNYTRVNYNYSAKKAHPSAYKNIVPRAVLMKTGLRSLNTVRPINTTQPKTTIYSARPMSCFSKSTQSTVKRPKAVNTTRPNLAVVNVVRGNQVNVVKASACWVWRPTKLNSASITLKRHNYVDGHLQKEDQGYVDSGCSRHMTGNMSYLSDFKEFDGGYVTFMGGTKGEKITSKGTLKTGKRDFKDVYFVKELQFNLFSVSQMCDKKNSVLFIDTRCFVLSLDFKLADESQVLLKVPRKKNMYSVDIKNSVPKESLTCRVAKATRDESMLWHRRLGHNASNDEPQPPSDARKKDDESVCKESGIVDQERPKNSTQVVNTAGQSINTELDMFSLGDNAHLKPHMLLSLSGVQTRRMTKTINEQGFISVVYEGKTHEDLHTYLFACFLSQVEPKKVIQALTDPSWIEAMQDELLQFKLQKVWTLVDLPYGKRAIGTKWVYRNKKDKRGIVVRNKKDVKSAFLYGKIEEEVYVCQPPGFEDPEFPDRVYK